MEKIGEMIERLCPEGVSRKVIKDVFTRLKGTPITAGQMKEIEDPDGDVVIFAGGKTIITAFEKDIPNANIISCPSVIVQSRGIIDVQYCVSPFTFKNEMWAYTNENVVCVKYLYYFLKQNIEILRKKGSEHGSMPQISLGATEDLEIPFPPLSVQQEIVRILDSFTSMITNLETELASRQKQYEYYRNKLLTFDENDESVEWKTLGDVSLYSTERINATELDESNYVSVENLLQNKSGKVNSTCCPNEGNWVKYSCGDTLIGNIRPNLRKIWLADIEGGTNGDVLVIHLKDGFRSAIISKYLYYILSSEDFFLYDIQNAKGAKMPRGDKNAVMKFPIAYPFPQRQREIVSTLDTFESLISNIKQELEARKKQYEYYREQLLTFE